MAGSKNATSDTNKTATQILILGERVRQRERERGERSLSLHSKNHRFLPFCLAHVANAHSKGAFHLVPELFLHLFPDLFLLFKALVTLVMSECLLLESLSMRTAAKLHGSISSSLLNGTIGHTLPMRSWSLSLLKTKWSL